jgi:hypothetical protein
MRTRPLPTPPSIACFVVACALMAAPVQATNTAPTTKSVTAVGKIAPSPQIQAAPTTAPIAAPPIDTVTPATQPSLPQAQRHEGRLKTLHENLKLSPEQDKLWEAVTKIMQDNQSKMNTLTSALAETHGVIATLKLNQTMTESRSAGLKSLLPAVEALYKTLDAEQKKLVDSDLLPPIPHLAPRPTLGGRVMP